MVKHLPMQIDIFFCHLSFAVIEKTTTVHRLPAQWEFSAFCIFGKGQKWSKTLDICAGGQ